jgi:hypothetical protein
MVYLRGVSGGTGVAEGVMQLQGGGWGLTAVWAIGGRQSHGRGVVVAALASSRLRLLVWFIVGNDSAVVGVYLSAPLPGLWCVIFHVVRCGCVV